MMKPQEMGHIAVAVIVLALVTGLQFIIENQFDLLIQAFIFSAVVIFAAVFSKKLAAYFLDANVEHEIWQMSTYGFKKSNRFNKPLPAGLIFPILASIITLGQVKFASLLTYEARALKYRASKRFGFYSFKEVTDWHHAIIGAASTISLLIIAAISYFSPTASLEYLSKISIYYAFWNLFPISKLDGAQIFFGSRILWAILATITVIILIMTIVVV